MKTLALVHGDLVIDGTGDYKTYSGADRIKQDLTLALQEEYGSNRFHTRWGSVINSYVGQVNNPNVRAAVQAEINRVLQNYIVIQQQEVLRDTQFDIAGRFDTSDVVRAVEGINVQAKYDAVYFSVTLRTVAREVVTISRQAGL